MPVKSIVRLLIPEKLLDIRSQLYRIKPIAKRKCPICNYYGYFKDAGRPPRVDARCPNCMSLERHRLFWLWYIENARSTIEEPVLHFAPEKTLESILREEFESGGGYQTADLFASADLKLNIEAIDLPDQTVRTVICNHVLEHVDDKKALAEINRILSEGGRLIVSVPIVEGWDKTYENPNIATPALRELHFGQADHVRLYGSDFRNRLSEASFTFEEVTAEGQAVIEYGLFPGEKFFVCRKIN